MTSYATLPCVKSLNYPSLPKEISLRHFRCSQESKKNLATSFPFIELKAYEKEIVREKKIQARIINFTYFSHQIKNIALFASGLLFYTGLEIYRYLASWKSSTLAIDEPHSCFVSPSASISMDRRKKETLEGLQVSNEIFFQNEWREKAARPEEFFSEENIHHFNHPSFRKTHDPYFYSDEEKIEWLEQTIKNKTKTIPKEEFQTVWNLISKSNDRLLHFACLCTENPLRECQEAVQNAWKILIKSHPKHAFKLATACSKVQQNQYQGNQKVLEKAFQNLLKKDAAGKTSYALKFFMKLSRKNPTPCQERVLLFAKTLLKTENLELILHAIDELSKIDEKQALILVEEAIATPENSRCHTIVDPIIHNFLANEKLVLALRLAKACAKTIVHQEMLQRTFTAFLNKNEPDPALELAKECINTLQFSGCLEILNNAVKCFLTIGALQSALDFHQYCKHRLKTAENNKKSEKFLIKLIRNQNKDLKEFTSNPLQSLAWEHANPLAITGF